MKQHLKKINSAFVVSGTILSALLGGIALWYYVQQWRTKDVNGKWKFTFHIKKSTYTSYVGKSAGWKIYLTQDGEKILGKGEMFWVNDAEIPYSQHIRLNCEGCIKGNKMTLQYTQYGAKRTTDGQIEAELKEPGVLEGNFSGTAADSEGIVNALKIVD